MNAMKKLFFTPFPEKLEDAIQGSVGVAGLTIALIPLFKIEVSWLSVLGILIGSVSLAPIVSKYFGSGKNDERKNGFIYSYCIAIVVIYIFAFTFLFFIINCFS